MSNWTKPHYGVSHLNNGTEKPFQVTAETHESFTRVYILHTGFTPIAEEMFDGEGHAEAAKAWGEARLRTLKGI
jgi:hypothetical protein